MSNCGTNSGSCSQKEKEDKKVKDVSCIVHFRPDNNWTGEYGFDWVRDNNHDGDFEELINNSSKDNGFYPMEFLYESNNIYSVEYKRCGKAWYINSLDFKDSTNGSEPLDGGQGKPFFHAVEQQANLSNNADSLDSFVDLGNHQLSIKGYNAPYSIPFYDFNTEQQQNDGSNIFREIVNNKDDKELKKIKTYLTDDTTIKVGKDVKTKTIKFCNWFRIEGRISSYDVNCYCTIKYVQFKNNTDSYSFFAVHTYQEEPNKSEKYKKNKRKNPAPWQCNNYIFDNNNRLIGLCYNNKWYYRYTNNKFVLFGTTGNGFFSRGNELSNEDYSESLSNQNYLFSKLEIGSDIVSICRKPLYLIFDKFKTNDATVTISYPDKIDEYPIQVVDNKWEGFDIVKWKDYYEDKYFIPRYYRIKGQNDVRKYSVPILSTGTSRLDRRRFDCNGGTDTAVRFADGYTVSFSIEGDVPDKLCFEDKKNIVEKIPDKDLQGSDKGIITIHPDPKLSMYAMKTVINVYANNIANGNPIGAIQFRVEKTEGLYAKYLRFLFINLSFRNPLGRNLDINSCPEDSISLLEDATRNVLFQAGIRPIFSRYSLNLDENTAEDKERKEISGWRSNSNGSVPKWKFQEKCNDNKTYRMQLLYNLLKRDLKNTDSRFYPMLDKYIVVFMVNCNMAKADGFSTRHVKDNKNVVIVRDLRRPINPDTKYYLLAHEVIHSLGLAHSFMLTDRNSICIPRRSTSNIMDYYTRRYSLHKYQWDAMQNGAIKLIKAWDSYCRDNNLDIE